MDRLLAEVKDLMSNKWLLSRLRYNLQKMDRVNSADQIQRDLLELCGDSTESGWAEEGRLA